MNVANLRHRLPLFFDIPKNRYAIQIGAKDYNLENYRIAFITLLSLYSKQAHPLYLSIV